MTYFGFALADSMFAGDCSIVRRSLTLEQAKEFIAQGVIPCLNPSHTATVAVMRAHGIEVEIPSTPPKVALQPGDDLIVMGVRGLPRLTDRHEYTKDEIEKATFSFSLYHVKI